MSDDIKVIYPAAGSNSMRLASQLFNRWAINVPHGVDPEAVLRPSFYKHQFMKLKPNDEVLVLADDGSWERLLRVQFVSKAGAQVSPIGPVVRHTNEEVLMGDDYFVKYVSPTLRHCIVRKSDGQRVKEKFVDEAAALHALAEMKKAA
jgi:hypothetical protein